MPPRNFDLREIRESHEFRNQITTLFPDWKRADDFIDGVTWTLQRNPEAGDLIRDGSNCRAVPSEEQPGMEPALVLYVYNDDMICLVAIIETIFGDGNPGENIEIPPLDGTELDPNRL